MIINIYFFTNKNNLSVHIWYNSMNYDYLCTQKTVVRVGFSNNSQ